MTSPSDTLLDKVGFHHINSEGPRGNTPVVLHLQSGQRGLAALYERLGEAPGAETRLLARMLRRDWELRIKPVLEAGQLILEQLQASSNVQPSPLAPLDAAPFASSLWSATPGELLRGVHAFASRALVSAELVPWVSSVLEVADHFRECVEAEDYHLSLIETLLELCS